ncbi:MAG TPA: Trm112 family protein [Pyrinomonadaceae bacterium]
MPITADFIETFNVVCPACKGKVVLKGDASGIKCTECRRVYPVRNDIPALIVEEATIEDEEPRQGD